MQDQNQIMAGLNALYYAMEAKQCFACAKEFIDDADEHADLIIANAEELINKQRDRRKTMEQLEALHDALIKNGCYTCSYELANVKSKYGESFIMDAVALLKEQELAEKERINANDLIKAFRQKWNAEHPVYEDTGGSMTYSEIIKFIQDFASE